MTPERLAHIRAHFKNPPSASCNAQWALEVCDALESLLAPAVPAALSETAHAPPAVVDETPEPKKKAKK